MSPKSNQFQGVSPVLLSAAVSVSANNAATPDSEQLSYPFRKAIIIEEIRWTIRTTVETATPLNIGALVYARMQFGQKYLMRDAVPIWLLGTIISGGVGEEESSPELDTATCYSSYRWRLPEPLYLEAGEILRSTFSRGNDGYSPFIVQVTYVGKTVAPSQPRPRIIAVPYAASFVTTLGQTYQQSNEKHLFNPFDTPLRVQRFTGRVLNVEGAGIAVSRMALTPSTAGGYVTLLINDSWGGKMVNNNTGPSDIFDFLRAAWTVDTIMPPKGVYEIRAWNIAATAPVHVGMIGVREERL